MQLSKVFPSSVKGFFYGVGALTTFTGAFFRSLVSRVPEVDEILEQCHRVGNKSLGLVSLTAGIIGIVMTLQILPTMREVGAESWLPATISVAVIREIGPVLTALITAGKIASSIGSEVGSMKVSEQIDAMKVSGIDAFHYLVVNRVLACGLMLPILVIYADFIALLGSYAALSMQESYSFQFYFHQALDLLRWIDIIGSISKSFFFGLAIGIISCYKGYQTSGGTAGVGLAANSSVVVASIAIFIIDLLAVQVTQFFTP